MKSFNERVARRLQDAKIELSKAWLEQLSDIVPVEDREVFPSDKLLDHIPSLLDEIAEYLLCPSDDAVAVSSKVLDKAAELGRLRHTQDASVHQILREYDILATILEDFVLNELADDDDSPAEEAIEVLRRINRSMRVLTQTTVDTFISEYGATIKRQRQHLEDFNRMLSHEMRGPMNTLRIVAALLAEKDTVSTDERRTLVDLIQGSVDRSLSLLGDLEVLAGFGSDTNSPAVQEVDLAAILQSVKDQLVDLAAADSVDIVVAEASVPAIVDIGRLELALVNLVGNAIKYCDRDKDRRWVRIDASVNEQALNVAVSDNGVGIHEDDLPKIFDRFFRGRSARSIDGTGLGLVIVRECIRSLGGTVDVESRVGEGTKFTLTVPTGD